MIWSLAVTVIQTFNLQLNANNQHNDLETRKGGTSTKTWNGNGIWDLIWNAVVCYQLNGGILEWLQQFLSRSGL